VQALLARQKHARTHPSRKRSFQLTTAPLRFAVAVAVAAREGAASKPLASHSACHTLGAPPSRRSWRLQQDSAATST
jgi:hypothetical protein